MGKTSQQNKDESYGPVDDLIGLVEEVPGASAQLRRLKWSYFLGPDLPPEPDDAVASRKEAWFTEAGRFLVWALMLPHGGERTLAEQALEQARQLSGEQREKLLRYARVRFRFARIERVDDAQTLVLTDVITGETFEVENPIAADLEPGSGLAGPVFEYQPGKFSFGQGVEVFVEMPDFSEYADTPDEAIGRMLGQVTTDASMDWIYDLDLRSWRAAYEDFAAALKPWGKLTPAGALQKRVANAEDIVDLWMQEKFVFWNDGEIQIFQAFAERLQELSLRQ